MGYIEQVSKNLFSYLPPLTRRPDFDEFWKTTIEKTKQVPLNMKMELYDYPSKYVKVYSITYNGFDETVIHGWYIVPQFSNKKKFPCVINYHGFTNDRGLPADFMQWITLMALELYDGSLNGITGKFYEDEVFVTDKEELETFEREFPYKEKLITDTQLK
jgi:cephalosporin-C deacetylase-like acetyl esterase